MLFSLEYFSVFAVSHCLISLSNFVCIIFSWLSNHICILTNVLEKWNVQKLKFKLWKYWPNILSVIYLLCVLHMFSHSVVSNSAVIRTVAHQVPLSIEFSRQEYYSGLPFSDPGIEPASLMSPALAVRFFNTSATWEAQR